MITVPDEVQLDEILHRGVADVIIEAEFVDLLRTGKQLRLKQGFDPSAPDIHLGHVVGLRKLKQLQDLGHQVVLIVGDWTARIGDPSGRSITRPMLTADEVKANAETYMEQFFKVIDRDKTEVRWQTEWFGDYSLADVIGLTSRFTVAQLLKRDDFAKRYHEGHPIAVTEILYPLLQAYDSVMVEADVEFGGTDQRFNNLLGRELQQQVGQRPQQVLLVPILVGTDGAQKMSKSLDNYVGVTEPPLAMFGKLMSISDELMPDYFELLTDRLGVEIEEATGQPERPAGNPMDLKKRLAGDIVTQFHGAIEAANARDHFERVVQRKEKPESVPTFPIAFAAPEGGPNRDAVVGALTEDGIPINILRLLVMAGIAASGSEARRLLQQGAVRLSGRQLTGGNAVVPVNHDTTIQVGNRRFVRVVDVTE